MTSETGDVTRNSPDWLEMALAQEPRWFDVDADGVRIRCRSWGDPKDRGLLLVHGGAAHSGWWDHIGPLLSRGYHVVAPDLSGHGDSDRRPAYDLVAWAHELATVAGHMQGPTILVGHSRGGRVGAVAASRHPDLFGHLVMIDSALVDKVPDHRTGEPRAARIYPTRHDAAAHFVTLPAQPVACPRIQQHVAFHSVRRVEAGWTWKFDPPTFKNTGRLAEALGTLSCPITYFRCENGIIPVGTEHGLRESFGAHLRLAELPGAGHHPMLDQPLALVAALRTQLAAWAT